MARSAAFTASLLSALLLSAPEALAGDPMGGCWKKQLQASADYARATGACLDKATRGKRFENCDLKREARLEKQWGKAADKAEAKGGECNDAQSAAKAAAQVRTALLGVRALFRESLEGDPDSSAGRALEGRLMKGAGSYAADLLEAEAKDAKKPDPEKLAAHPAANRTCRFALKGNNLQAFLIGRQILQTVISCACRGCRCDQGHDQGCAQGQEMNFGPLGEQGPVLPGDDWLF